LAPFSYTRRRLVPTLSASELDAIHAAAAPLDKRKRAAFEAAVLAALDRHAVVGPGVIHRAIREHQRAFWDPPSIGGVPMHHAAHSKLRSGPAIPD
jgi:hypothetical protein